METSKHPLKVLVVEDDEPSRTVLVSLAREEGHEVFEAVNGAEGLKQFQARQPDLVFSDISMPVMDGLQMLEKIRGLSHETLVVMTTAFGSAEFTLKALRLKANDYLVKPILPHDFIANLRKYADLIANRTAEREVVGLILHRQLTLKLGNKPDLVSKVTDRLMQETEGRIPPGERMGVHLGLFEIILNGIEHGNLAITFDEKSAGLEGESGAWEKLLAARLADPRFKDRNVLIQFEMDGESCEWTITDDGMGFDWQKIPDPNAPENLLSSHGRGVMLTRLHFDDVSYLGKGNQVVLRKKLPQL